MPWPKSSVPKFGNWDKNEDLSYSIVFDKVRAEKERSLHSLDGDFENVSSIRSVSPKSDGGTGNRTSQSFFPVKVRGKRENFLHTAKENRRFTPSHQNAFRNFEETTEKETFHDNNGTKDFGYRSPTISSWQAAVLRDHQNVGSQRYFNHLQANPPQNLLGAPTYNPLLVSGDPPRKIGATKDSGRHMYQEELANAKARGPRESFDMQENPTVPKFGDWEHGDGFTTIFNNVRKERGSKHTPMPTVGAAPLRTDEDLYEGSERNKHQRSCLSIICCFKPYS